MVHVEYEQIPKIQIEILSRTILSAVEAFYSVPENLSRFEDWMNSEEGKAYVQRNSKNNM